MKLPGGLSLNRDFDFRSAARWLLLGSIVGVISGLGAILFQTLLVYLREFSVNHLMGLHPGIPGGEPQTQHFLTGGFRPYLIVLLPALGGLIALSSGLLLKPKDTVLMKR